MWQSHGRLYVFTRRSVCVFHPILSRTPFLQRPLMPKAPPIKLLIVDDHAELRRTVKQMFESVNATFFEASSGEEALQVTATEHPDWVIMDMRMPGMGGIKATEAIHKRDPQARVVVISQFSDPEYIEQARRAGAIEFVNKEDMAHLVDIVRGGSPLQP
jgi:DNA-binding NarL/FixJ family response regulator